MRPDIFGRVVCFLPSFAQMPNGNPYPDAHRRARRANRCGSSSRPLTATSAGTSRRTNWFAENLRVVAALAEADYDVRLVLGDGGHDANHAGVLLPDALRWVFGSR